MSSGENMGGSRKRKWENDFFFNLKNNKAITGELKRSQGCLEEAH